MTAAGDLSVNGVRLHYEARGRGAAILCVHGGGSSALVWADAAERLARLGRVIAYDRRGCGRSERPEPYERTTVAEHADDAAALLEPDAPGLSAAADAWVAAFSGRMRAVAADAELGAVGEALITEVAGPDARRSFPDDVRRMLTDIDPASLEVIAFIEEVLGPGGRLAGPGRLGG